MEVFRQPIGEEIFKRVRPIREVDRTFKQPIETEPVNKTILIFKQAIAEVVECRHLIDEVLTFKGPIGETALCHPSTEVKMVTEEIGAFWLTIERIV